MKRILAVLIAVMLLVAAIPATSMAEIVSNGDNKVYHASTNGSTLRVHREASLNAAIVTSVPNGTALQQTSSKTVKKDGHVWMRSRHPTAPAAGFPRSGSRKMPTLTSIPKRTA